MAGYSTRNFLLAGVTQAIGNSETDTPVTTNFKISESDADNLMVKIECSSVSATATIKLQHTWNAEDGFEDVSGATVAAANGFVEIATTGPLWPVGRIVVTTNGSGAVDVDAVYVSRRT